MDEQQVPTAPEAAEEPAVAAVGGDKKLWVRFLIGAAAVAVFVVCLIQQGNNGPKPDTYSAKKACEGFVKDRLKAPATADFSGETVTVNGSTFSVTGSVDAENSFGAKLRATFTCVVQDAGGEWRLASLTGL